MESENEFRRRLAAAENMAVRQRNYRRARDRALAKLAGMYREAYIELLAQEKEKDEQEGKKWNSLAGAFPDYKFDSTDILTREGGVTPTQDSESEGDSK